MLTSHVAAWRSSAPTPAQLKELFAQIESGRITSAVVQSLLRGETGFKHEALCRNVLVGDIIFPEDIEGVTNLRYPHEDHAEYRRKLPNQDLLWWCRKNEYALIAGPPLPLSLSDLYGMWPERFQKMPNIKAGYVTHEKVSPGWLYIGKRVVLVSAHLPQSAQIKLLSPKERLPNIAELGWALFIYRIVRSRWLLDCEALRTSTMAQNGKNVRGGNSGSTFWFDEWGIDERYTSIAPVRVLA